VTVCLENAKTWHDKKKGRVVSTDLALINTGSQVRRLMFVHN
jgi:hypothetical protein